MFDFLEIFSFGRKIKCNDKPFIVLKDLQKGYCLAAEPNAILPCSVYLIKDDNYKEPEIQGGPDGQG